MDFAIRLPLSPTTALTLQASIGTPLFLLGANGSGKSTLMGAFCANHPGSAVRIMAHRQTWFSSNAADITASNKIEYERAMRSNDISTEARWRDSYTQYRASISIFAAVEAENVRARLIADTMAAGNVDGALKLAKKNSPIATLNELLASSNIPIKITLQGDGLWATKHDGAPYSVAQLSDGERAALLLAADVLTAKAGALLVIDEPERHLHRSIVTPLLGQLFSHRPDCGFVISTHDVLLPQSIPGSQTALVRSCRYEGMGVVGYDVDVVPASTSIPDDLRREILGARQRVLFVEGDDGSLDKPLYAIVFPNVSVIAKRTSREVMQAIRGVRGATEFHWLHAFGLIDGDNRGESELARLNTEGIYAPNRVTVESIYYDEVVQKKAAERLASVTGDAPDIMCQKAKSAALNAVLPHAQRLCERVAERKIRAKLFASLPTPEQISSAALIEVRIDAQEVLAEELTHFAHLHGQGDLTGIVCRYSVRETPALTEIARNLGFKGRSQYEQTVRTLLLQDPTTLKHVREQFGSLYSEMGGSPTDAGASSATPPLQHTLAPASAAAL